MSTYSREWGAVLVVVVLVVAALGFGAPAGADWSVEPGTPDGEKVYDPDPEPGVCEAIVLDYDEQFDSAGGWARGELVVLGCEAEEHGFHYGHARRWMEQFVDLDCDDEENDEPGWGSNFAYGERWYIDEFDAPSNGNVACNWGVIMPHEHEDQSFCGHDEGDQPQKTKEDNWCVEAFSQDVVNNSQALIWWLVDLEVVEEQGMPVVEGAVEYHEISTLSDPSNDVNVYPP